MTMNATAIAWTDHTWNLFSGCKKISPECAHCYAEHLSEKHRRGSEAKGKSSPAFPHGFDLTVRPAKLTEPAKLLRSKGPSLIFCESMSDIGLDDGELTPGELDRLHAQNIRGMDHVRETFFDTIEATPEHRYQVLTKRPERLFRFFAEAGRTVPPSVWLGVTCGHPKSLYRLDTLRDFRALGARVLFVSAEPLLGDLAAAGMKLDGIDWVIVGGESGSHVSDPKLVNRFLVRRPCWVPTDEAKTRARRLLDEAQRTGAAFFFKQWGGPKPESGGRLLDGRTWDELPTVPGALPVRRTDLGGAATAALARKLPVVRA